MFKAIGKGVLRAVIITVTMLILLTVVISMTEISNRTMSVYYLVVTCISIVFGSVYAAKKHTKKGWLLGLMVAFVYMSVIYFASFIFYQDVIFTTRDFLRISIAIVVGILSGMLGINI